MPVTFGSDKRGCYAQWGSQKKYYYKCGNKEARDRAKKRAEEQARAIRATGYRDDHRSDAKPGNKRGEDIKQQLEIIGVEKPKGRPRPYRYPMRLERDYWSRIRRNFMNPLKKQMREMLLPEIGRLKRIYERETGKRDSYSSEISEIADNLRVEYERDVLPAAEGVAVQQATLLENEHFRQTSKMNKAILTINPVEAEPWLAPVTDSFVRENVNYIKKDIAQHYTEVEGIIRRGLESGESVGVMQKKIMGRYGMTERRSKLIARDQTNKFFGQLTRERSTDIGITHFIWVTAGDSRVRDEHVDLAGQRFSWKNGADGLFPGMDIQCRCVAKNDYSVFF